MRTAVALLTSNMVTAQRVPVELRGPYVVATGVYLGNRGPFRFLLDTGAQICTVSEELSAKLNLRPQGQLDVLTVAGSRTLAAATLNHLALGGVEVRFAETAIAGLERVRALDRRIEGILGQNFLRAADYILRFDRSEMIFNVRPESLRGVPIPFSLASARPLVAAEVDGSVRHLVLDSGAPALILFGGRGAGTAWGSSQVLRTAAGQTTAFMSVMPVRIGPRVHLLKAAEISGRDPDENAGGLLPLSAFTSVYVNNREGYIMLEPEITITSRLTKSTSILQ